MLKNAQIRLIMQDAAIIQRKLLIDGRPYKHPETLPQPHREGCSPRNKSRY